MNKHLNSTELLIIRHGETAWNVAGKLQGHIDIPLNAQGTRQAKSLASYLQTEKLDAIISSDLHRAVQTAGEIARLQGVSTRIDKDLRERCFGGFEGKLKDDLPTLFPVEYKNWRSRDPDFQFPPSDDDHTYRGESTRQFHQRIIACITHYAKQHQGKRIAIIAHGGVLECAYREAKKLPLTAEREVKLFNASINRFAWKEDGLHILQWGDVAHLEQSVLDEIV